MKPGRSVKRITKTLGLKENIWDVFNIRIFGFFDPFLYLIPGLWVVLGLEACNIPTAL